MPEPCENPACTTGKHAEIILHMSVQGAARKPVKLCSPCAREAWTKDPSLFGKPEADEKKPKARKR